MSGPTVTLLGPRPRAADARATVQQWPPGRLAVASGAAYRALPLDRELSELSLASRWRAVLDADPGLDQADQRLRTVLADRQALYATALRHALAATAELARASTSPPDRTAATRAALEQVRGLDRDHLGAVGALRNDFLEVLASSDHLAEHRREVADLLTESAGLLLAGDHVGELVHLGEVFGIRSSAPASVLAWGAGVMLLGERILLFHDHDVSGPHPPQFLADGWGWLSQAVILPDARRRLALHDRARMRTLAQRLLPAAGVLLDDREWVMVSDHELPGAARLLDHRAPWASGVDHGAI